MSRELSNWLMSHRSDFMPSSNQGEKPTRTKTKVIAVASGKGGVGKTSTSILLSKSLAKLGFKTLLVDCDYNLSNTAVKLNLPLNDNFFSLLSMEKTFEECLHKFENFHLLTGCNGNSDLFDKSFEHDRFLIDIIHSHGSSYDYIILDCPAGINKETINIAAYADYRFMIVNPDKSSITDTYALIKILKQKYSVKENHLLLNKVSSEAQYKRVVKSLIDTVSTFLGGQLRVLGMLERIDAPTDKFDRILKEEAKNSIHENVSKIVKSFADESTEHIGVKFPFGFKNSHGQEVQTTN